MDNDHTNVRKKVKKGSKYILYYESGCKYVGTVKDKTREREGVGTVFLKSGKKFVTGEWKSDKLDGKAKVFYENGKTKIDGNFKNGKKEGKVIMYKEDGSKSVELYEDDYLQDILD